MPLSSIWANVYNITWSLWLVQEVHSIIAILQVLDESVWATLVYRNFQHCYKPNYLRETMLPLPNH